MKHSYLTITDQFCGAGEPVQIPARTTVKFKPGKFLLEAMNGKG